MIWKIIKEAREFSLKCKKDKINAYSAQSAFFIVLSIIPFLMLFSSLLRYTSITEEILLQVIQKVMPQYVAPFIVSLVEEVYTNSMGLVSASGIVAVWSAAKGVQYMADGLNSVNGLEETRNWLVLRFWAVIYTVIFIVAIVVTLVVLVCGNSIQSFVVRAFPWIGKLVSVLERCRGIWMLVFLILFFDIIFAALPNRKLTLKSQLPGAVICAVAWYVFSFGLSVYVDYFNGFSMYGSLTTIVLMMLWLYFCMYIMMMSAEFNLMFQDHFPAWFREKKKP